MKLSLATAALLAVASAAPVQPNAEIDSAAVVERREEAKDTCEVWIKKEKDWLGFPWIAKRHRYLAAFVTTGNENNNVIANDFCRYWTAGPENTNNVLVEDADNPQCHLDNQSGFFIRITADVTIPYYSDHSKFVQNKIDKLNGNKGVKCTIHNEGGW